MRLAWICIVCASFFISLAVGSATALGAWEGHQGYDTASSYCAKCHSMDRGVPDQSWIKTQEVSSTCQTCHSPYGAAAGRYSWTSSSGQAVAVTGSNTPVYQAGGPGFSIPQDGRPGHQLSAYSTPAAGSAAPSLFKITNSHNGGAAVSQFKKYTPETYCSTCHLSHTYSTVDSRRGTATATTSSASTSSASNYDNSNMISASYAHASEGNDGYCISCHYAGSMP